VETPQEILLSQSDSAIALDAGHGWTASLRAGAHLWALQTGQMRGLPR